MSDALVREVAAALRDHGAFDGVTLDRVTVGDAAVLVELRASPVDGDASDPERTGAAEPGIRAGVAHRPPGTPPEAAGADVETLVGWATGNPPADGDAAVARAVGVAALNALSAPFVDWRDGDPMARLSPAVETIATVGLFRPAFRKFDAVDVRVVERDAVDPASVGTPPGVAVSVYPSEEIAEAMAGAEVVFVTGSTLVYGGLDDALAAAPPEATVVVVGATASVLPDPLFAAGADVVAGAAVDDPERVRAAVEAGACGTDLHDEGLDKVYAAATRTDGVDLRGARTAVDATARDGHDDGHDDATTNETPEP